MEQPEGIAGAVAALARELDVDLGTVGVAEEHPATTALVESLVEPREPMRIDGSPGGPTFVVDGWSRGVHLAGGATTDLGQIVRAAGAWRHAATLAEITAAAPFLEVDDHARATELGPAEEVAVQWRHLRRRWAGISDKDPAFRFVVDIIDAAQAQPVLRALYPYTSLASLCFSFTTGVWKSWALWGTVALALGLVTGFFPGSST
nr:hypothetical protein GCM10020063_107210 [Dactylosporangium thailandense]